MYSSELHKQGEDAWSALTQIWHILLDKDGIGGFGSWLDHHIYYDVKNCLLASVVKCQKYDKTLVLYLIKGLCQLSWFLQGILQ